MLGARAVTFVLSALVAASAVYWGLPWGGTQANTSTSTQPIPSATAVPDPQAVARALGGGMAVATATATAASASPAASAYSRLTLVGVVADAHSAGLALIAIDGKPAKPFRVGATVDGSLVLQSVGARKATLGADRDAVAQVVLELPTLPK
jgi:general secretion pathway protein C